MTVLAKNAAPTCPQQAGSEPGAARSRDWRLGAVKVFAAAAMTCDHVDLFIFDGRLGLAATIGRLAMPFFVFVLAFNLTRETRRPGAEWRSARRMLAWGVLASVPYVLLTDRWLPLNVMFSLALCVFLAWFVRTSLRSAAARELHFEQVLFLCIPPLLLVAALGAVVEYHWWLLLLFAACSWWCKRPGWASGAGLAGSLLALYPFHNSFWPLLALPIIVMVAALQRRGSTRPVSADPVQLPGASSSPRLLLLLRGQGFHAFYLLHLCVIVVARDFLT